MPRSRVDCPVPGCVSTNLLKLSNHLKQYHGLNGSNRKARLQKKRVKNIKTYAVHGTKVKSLVEWSPQNPLIEQWWKSESLLPFKPCSSITISGATQSGKTYFVHKLLQNISGMFSEEPVSQILYCYGIYQSLFDKMEKDIPNFTLHEGLPSKEDIENFSAKQKHSLIILDDLMIQVGQSPEIERLFTMGCHHRKLSVIYLTQNIFQQSKCSRTIALNTHYLILFRNLRDGSQVTHLGRQLFPGKGQILVDAYQAATRVPYGYLVIDMSPHSEDKYRLRTQIFPGEDPIVYIPRTV